MDRLGGTFGAHDDALGGADPLGSDPAEDIATDEDSHVPHPPPSPVGQDERRMQVRAYNHWASLLGDRNFPDIAHLDPAALNDFGPHGVLLDFGSEGGIEDPAIRFVGAALAEECGEDGGYTRLSEVPGRSLLSRITDHYMQILANQAPIGFEAEFVNQHGVEVLYRGILLPWSSDGETIDYVFGVINWKELADAATADALLAAIDEAFEAPIAPYEGKDMDRMLDLSGFPEDNGETDHGAGLPLPAFGAAREDVSSPFDLTEAFEEAAEEDSEDDEDAAEATEWGAGFSGFGDEDTVYTVDYGDQGLEEGEDDEDFDGVVDPLADDTASLGLASLVARSGRVKQSVSLPGMDGYAAPATVTPAEAEPAAPGFTTSVVRPSESVARTTLEQRLRAAIPQGYGADETPPPMPRAPVFAPPAAFDAGSGSGSGVEAPLELGGHLEVPAPFERDFNRVREAFGHDAEEPVAEAAPKSVLPEEPFDADRLAGEDAESGNDESEGLYDCLAAARELAQTARSSEDRGRKALYQAVARAYDFSLEAAANPADFDELLAENGLTVQERAPMTPVVKLVFGADYDKTRLTEYATVLSYAHRTGVARGTLDQVLASAEGGLKGIVSTERAARREAEGKPVAAPAGVRSSLARKLRKRGAIGFDELAQDGPEFALVMVRRTAEGEVEIVGEVPEDVALVEKAARKILN